MAEEPSKKTVDDLIKSLEKRFNKKIEGKVVIDKKHYWRHQDYSW